MMRYTAAAGWAALSIAMAMPGQAAAQESAEDQASGLQDIVVTATRREENLRNVPIAVTAVTGETLSERQITEVTGLQRLAPSLTTAPFGDSTSPLIAMRGLVASDIVMPIDPAVGIYLDGIYLGRATGGNLNLIDVARVEVLRGPQGTLFGRNTIGGAISITPRRPTDELSASLSGTIGNFDRKEITGVLNLPVADGIAFRVAASHQDRDGYAKSSLTGADLSAENLNYVRGALNVDFAPGWNLLVSGDYTRSRNQGQWVTMLKSFPIAEQVAALVTNGQQTAAQFVDPFSRRPASQTTGPFVSRNWGGSAVLTGELGDVSVKSLTAYREVFRQLTGFDQDSSPFELLQIALNRTTQHQFSQEFQLYGKVLDERLDWIVGAYYFKESGRDTVASHAVFPLSPNYAVTDASATNRNHAIYGQLTFSITDQIALVGGVRYTKDKRSIVQYSRTARPTPNDPIACVVAGAALPICRLPIKPKSFDYIPFTMGVNFKPSDAALLYAKWSRGFRSGGFNTRGTSENALLPYSPERVDSYEAGAKIDIARRFRINAAAYLSDYKGIQVLQTIGLTSGLPISVTQNAGDARIKGVEIEAEAALGALRLNGSYAYTDAGYRSLRTGVIGLLKNSPFLFTPKHSASLGASYTIPTGFGSVVANGDYSWRSRTYFAPSPPADPLTSQKGYGLVNASVTANIGDHAKLAAFVRNLTDRHYFERVTNLVSAGFLNGYPGDPRTYGITAGYEF